MEPNIKSEIRGEKENDVFGLIKESSDSKHKIKTELRRLEFPTQRTEDSKKHVLVFKPEPVINVEKERSKLDGVGFLLSVLRGEYKPPQKERIVLDELGFRVRDSSKFPVSHIAKMQENLAVASRAQSGGPSFFEGPTDVRLARKTIRQKMLRCKKCKNRFLEKNLYERHLRDRHPDLYEKHLKQEKEEYDQQMKEDREKAQREEYRSLILPEKDISVPSEAPYRIPLPGENNYGIVPRLDKYGRVIGEKRVYKKKISPQCPFCDKRFKHEYSLKKHLIKTHKELSEFKQCLKCFKSLNEKDMASHDCELTYVCFECTPIRNMCTESRLHLHRTKFHRGADSGFKCNMCNMKFLTPRQLRKHKKTDHVFTNTIQCHFCDERFINQTGVAVHERIHTGIIKFECNVCSVSLNRYTDMEKHKKEEHGYICPICQDKFIEVMELNQHVLEEHGGYMTDGGSSGYVDSPQTWLLYKGE